MRFMSLAADSTSGSTSSSVSPSTFLASKASAFSLNTFRRAGEGKVGVNYSSAMYEV